MFNPIPLGRQYKYTPEMKPSFKIPWNWNNILAPKLIASPFIEDSLDWVQFRFPRSKKKRIRKKWSKNLLNFKLQKQAQMLFHKPSNTFFCSEETKKMIEKAMVEE